MIERQPAAERGLSDLQHGAGIVAAAGEFAERFEQRHVRALFAEIGGEIQHDVAFADRVEHVGGAHALVRARASADASSGAGARNSMLVEAEPGARELAVIGGRIAGGGFVARAHRILPGQGASAARPRQ